MADMNPQYLTRENLAKFLPTHELRIAFEQLLKQVAQVIPQDVDQAQATATLAQDLAHYASSDAARALAAVMELAAAGVSSHGEAGRISALERRIADLESQLQLTQQVNLSDLRRQVAELQALLVGA